VSYRFWIRPLSWIASNTIPSAGASKNDMQFRKAVPERAGLGVELPAEKSVVGPNGPKVENEVVLEMAASV